MIRRILLALTAAAVLSSPSFCQDAPPAQTPGQPDTQPDAQASQQRGPGGWLGRAGQRGTAGTVTAVAADHFTVKNESGETWTIHFSANTRVMRQPPQPARGTEPREPNERWGGAPTPIKASDIKVGDMIMSLGERDEAAKSIGAMTILQLDPERAKQMRAMQANFGKTWLMGRITAMDETKITLHSAVDNADHSFVVDENTSFRRRREPVTLADIKTGDNVRVEGALKEGQFVATAVAVMMPPAEGGPARRQGPPPQ